MQYAWIALAMLCAGCTQPLDSGTSTPTTDPTDPLHGPGGVAITGQVSRWGDAYVANVSAYNAGPTHGILQSYCVSGYGAWESRLLDASGTVLRHRNPNANQLGCAGSLMAMPTGSYWNWTVEDVRCDTRYVCDNIWDGLIWTPSGEGKPAPRGTYTWEFTFRYTDRPRDFEGGDPGELHELRLEFSLQR
jgi:hypothetical protein